MLRILCAILLLTSCSLGTRTKGGERRYVYDSSREYNVEELKALSPEFVETSQRDPAVGSLDELFSKNQKPLKRIGIIIFETEIQPTRGGLSDANEVFVSEQGKQLITEKFLKIWEESLRMLYPDLEYVPVSKIKKAVTYHKYGLPQDDFIKTKHPTLAPDDMFFLEPGKKTTTTTILNPRGMRDMSFVLVPAYELMAGPKWSEHNKHFLNDVTKELKLDAAIIIMSKVNWTKAHTEKHSGENIPENMSFDVKASTLIPLHDYHARLDVLKKTERPGVTLCYRAYESEINIPVKLTLEAEKKTFETIETEIITPMFKTYKDLSQMTMIQIVEDLKKTW